MKMLIYVGDLVTDMPGIFLGGLIARHLNLKITLLHVAPKSQQKKQEQKEGEAILKQAQEYLAGLVVETRIRRGRVAQKILAEVQEKQHDMVVITASRIGGYPQRISVNREILPKMPCCVIVAKNPKPEIKKILMLTGGLQGSEAMIKIGARLASALEAKVTLMHVAANVPSMYTGLYSIEETLEGLLQTNTPVAIHLRKCAKMLAKHNVPSELKLKHGEPVYEIIREIDSEDYELVILGASGVTTGLKEWFLGNVTKDIIDLVAMPVMVVNQAHAKKMDDTEI
jgi:nucleotide-binding universal stress UspA family protein